MIFSGCWCCSCNKLWQRARCTIKPRRERCPWIGSPNTGLQQCAYFTSTPSVPKIKRAELLEVWIASSANKWLATSCGSKSPTAICSNKCSLSFKCRQLRTFSQSAELKSFTERLNSFKARFKACWPTRRCSSWSWSRRMFCNARRAFCVLMKLSQSGFGVASTSVIISMTCPLVSGVESGLVSPFTFAPTAWFPRNKLAE